jgi:tetratricopeptide (TPR) repeat protein
MQPIISATLLLLLLTGVCGCKQETAPATEKIKPPATKTAAARLLSEPLRTTITESLSEALPVWRRHQQQRPALLLLANDPYLQKIPPPLFDETLQLINQGSAAEIARRTSRPGPNPLMFPAMTVTAALEAELISEVIWVLPIASSTEKVNLQVFRDQLARYRTGNAEQLPQIRLQGDALSGTISGKPFRAVSLEQLPELTGPLLLHIDLGFFSPLYRHEIGTPIYQLIYKVLSRLREQGWSGLHATVSTANLDSQLPLKTRFLADNIKTLIENPALLEQPVPASWIQRAQILYLENFLQKEKILNLYLAMATENPDNPSIQYGLYQIMRRFKEAETAFSYLKKAVELDPIYAIEYLTLAQFADDKKHPDAALRMLDKAGAVFPQDPFIVLKKAQLLIATGQGEQALPLLDQLKSLTWSTVYDPQMPEELEQLTKLAQEAREQD